MANHGATSEPVCLMSMIHVDKESDPVAISMATYQTGDGRKSLR